MQMYNTSLECHSESKIERVETKSQEVLSLQCFVYDKSNDEKEKRRNSN